MTALSFGDIAGERSLMTLLLMAAATSIWSLFVLLAMPTGIMLDLRAGLERDYIWTNAGNDWLKLQRPPERRSKTARVPSDLCPTRCL